jgi:putative ATP-dependent endonuclease of OLD family
MLSPRGQSLLGMIGLFSKTDEAEVPLSNAGLGTQQLTLFTLATSLIANTPLFVIDEIESGLEPFRQRELIARIRDRIAADGQAFVTSHSPAAVGEMTIAELYRVDEAEDGAHEVSAYPVALSGMKQADPEALLCRLPIHRGNDRSRAPRVPPRGDARTGRDDARFTGHPSRRRRRATPGVHAAAGAP